MGLFSGITDLLGGGSSGPSYQPITTKNAQFSTGNLQFGEDLLKNRMITPVTGLDSAGRAGVDLNNQRLQQDLSQNAGLNQGATDTAIANAGLYGTDRGAVSRMSQAGLNAGAKSNQGIMANASNQNLITTQNNLQGQLDQQNNAINNSMQTFSYIPTIQNAQEQYNNGMQNQALFANQQGQALQGAANQQKRGGLFSSIGGLAGAAFGGPLGAGIGSSIGGMFA